MHPQFEAEERNVVHEATRAAADIRDNTQEARTGDDDADDDDARAGTGNIDKDIGV